MADSDLEAIKKIAGLKDSKKMTADNQLDRLLGKVWRNPFDVLQLHMGASDEEIKKQYKLVGPQLILVYDSPTSGQVFRSSGL